MGEITISTKEYRELVESKVRIDVFSDFVNSQQYSISRGECARILGFELEDAKEES